MSISEDKSFPELRFEGFTDAWEQRKLGELAEIVGGGTPSTNIPEYWNGEFDWYSPVELGEQLYLDGSRKKITEIGLQKSSAKILPVGTILFTSRAGIGNTAILAKEGATNQGFQSIVPHKENLDTYFIYSRSDELKRYGEVTGAGSTFVEVSGKQMKKMSISIPVLDEQKKIGMFFETLDNTIALHQEKLCRLHKLKKGYQQIILPQKEKNSPEIRVAYFQDKWEQHKLGKVAKITMGQSPNGKNYTNNPNDYILVQGNADIKDGEVVPRVWTTQITKTANSQDIILSVRAPVGDVAKTNYQVVLGRGVAGIEGNEFVYQTLLNMKENGYWKKVSTGSTFESINSKDLKEALIHVPSKKEQYMIGNFLKQLDDNISLYQIKIKTLLDLKKSFLQKLFV